MYVFIFNSCAHLFVFCPSHSTVSFLRARRLSAGSLNVHGMNEFGVELQKCAQGEYLLHSRCPSHPAYVMNTPLSFPSIPTMPRQYGTTISPCDLSHQLCWAGSTISISHALKLRLTETELERLASEESEKAWLELSFIPLKQ